MTLRELIAEIKKLNSAEQYRLKEFFINSIASFSFSEPVFREVTERKNKDDTLVYIVVLSKLYVLVSMG
ncbi:hypothetical protein [Heyndrickxia ginsengihumi]